MTKKDFEVIATILKQTRPSGYGYSIDSLIDRSIKDGKWAQWTATRNEFIKILSLENPRFDSERFRKATEE